MQLSNTADPPHTPAQSCIQSFEGSSSHTPHISSRLLPFGTSAQSRQLELSPLHTPHSSNTPTHSSSESQIPSKSASSQISKHSDSWLGISWPTKLDKIILVKHAESKSPLTSTCINVPLPAGIVAPVNENAIIRSPPVCIVKPASAAAPPEALNKSTPSTLNWKPPMAVTELYNTS